MIGLSPNGSRRARSVNLARPLQPTDVALGMRDYPLRALGSALIVRVGPEHKDRPGGSDEPDRASSTDQRTTRPTWRSASSGPSRAPADGERGERREHRRTSWSRWELTSRRGRPATSGSTTSSLASSRQRSMSSRCGVRSSVPVVPAREEVDPVEVGVGGDQTRDEYISTSPRNRRSALGGRPGSFPGSLPRATSAASCSASVVLPRPGSPTSSVSIPSGIHPVHSHRTLAGLPCPPSGPRYC